MRDNLNIVQQALILTKEWQQSIEQIITKNTEDDKLHYQVKVMLDNPEEKYFMMELLDQSFRSNDYVRIKDQMVFIFEKYGIPKFLSFKEKCLVNLFLTIGKYIPNITVPLFARQVMKNTAKIVLSAERKDLEVHLKKRKKEKTRINLNLIGEVVLGEQEALRRISEYLNALKNPHINYVSIKISTIYSQINALDFEKNIEVISKRLSLIYEQAMNNTFTNRYAQQEHKFINLDMEEYRDLELTVAVFMKTLDQPKFKLLKAGIVLQAYLPDSFAYQEKLTEWARKRVEKGGSKIKIRLVKGANKEMEETESSLKHWALTTYSDKSDTDANYKKMLEYALKLNNAKVVDVGIASHNLFELAYAFIYAKAQNSLVYMTFEMLEGMNEKAYSLIKKQQEVILYTPAATKENFINAIAYLFRRLDENTSPNNFMRYIFGLKVNSPQWKRLEKVFLRSFAKKDSVKSTPNRVQDRLQENHTQIDNLITYHPEPDTDFMLPQNRVWAKTIRDKWQRSLNSTPLIVPIVCAGEEITNLRKQNEIKDKNQEFLTVGYYCIASDEDLQKAIDIAEKDPDGWRQKNLKDRAKIMNQVANVFRNRRGDLIGVAALEVGKLFTETDVEVSEAVDFVNFYVHATFKLQKDLPHLKMSPKGVGLVIPPWNFPIAIPTGGIASALATGNTVIIKPSSNAVACAYELCKCFWEGGISKNTLQLLPCSGKMASEHLISSGKIDFVTFTGGEDTALKIQDKKSDIFLTAETGGKNAIIVTNMADKEKAISDIVQSAFSNSGQKCSACSLLILEKGVYDHLQFKTMLIDAVKSLKVGSVWNFSNKISTLANPISGNLKKALKELEEGEEWVLPPKIDNDYLLHPCIKYGVKKENFTFNTELFAPVLSVAKANNLSEAIDMVNSTGYGLTSGLHSLDEREINQWKKSIKSGNLYINRTITGAIVLRQPFGGMGKSAIGMGRKVGIYNYVTQFMNYEEISLPNAKNIQHPIIKIIDSLDDNFKADKDKLKASLYSYIENYKQEFTLERDYSNIRGEDNYFGYISIKKALLRVSEKDSLFDILSRIIACKIVGVELKMSVKNDFKSAVIDTVLASGILNKNAIVYQDENSLIDIINQYDRIFLSTHISIGDAIYRAANTAGVPIVSTPPLTEGRIELLNYFLEQNVTHSYHRYGNLGSRVWKQ